MKEKVTKAENDISDILDRLQKELAMADTGFRVNQISFAPFGRKIESTPPGYGYFMTKVKILIQAEDV